jgi:hypothetical protein
MYRIEVQHQSDHDLDGRWYELDVTNDEESAKRLVAYFEGWRTRKDGTRYLSGMGYGGRAVRYVAA